MPSQVLDMAIDLGLHCCICLQNKRLIRLYSARLKLHTIFGLSEFNRVKLLGTIFVGDSNRWKNFSAFRNTS